MASPKRQKRSPGETGSVPSRGGLGGTVFSLSEDETIEIGRRLGRALRGGALVVLQGELGLGKTVFARGIASGLGVAPEEVSSPSFTLVQEYRGGRLPLFHVDLYRVEDLEEEIPSLGIEEILAEGGIAMIEWGERLPPYLRRGAVVVRLHDLGDGCRRIEIGAEPDRAPRPPGDA